ncbi:MAG: ABC transporter permease [Synergistaceae bacterium]|jgi:ribose transport system permease protein|nr:ABC transporter permease [Synergistaceae bacterium]
MIDAVSEKSSFQIKWSNYSILIGIMLVVLIFSAVTDTFLTVRNISRLLRQMVVFMIIASGMTFVVSTGEMDISVGAIYNLSMNIMGFLILSGLNPWFASIAGVCTGLLCGFLNGVLTMTLGIRAIIITLGTVNIFKGITLVFTNAHGIGNLMQSNFFEFGKSSIGPVASIFYVALLIVTITAWYFNNSKICRDFRAMGSNIKAAVYSGVPVKKRIVQNLTIMGFFCGLSSVLALSYIGSAAPEAGSGYEMLAITAVVAGGANVNGGDGSVWGTMGGIVLITVIRNGLMLMGLSPAWQEAATGFLLIGAIAVQKLSKRSAG